MRRMAFGVPSLALATGGGLWAQARRAAHAPLPQFLDHDLSGSYGARNGPALRLTLLGDSSLTGPGLESPGHSFMAQVADSLPWNVGVQSMARGGSRVLDVLVRQAPAAIMTRPDAFVVAVGTNDVAHGTRAGAFRRRLAALLDLLEPVAPVVLFGVADLSIIPRTPSMWRPIMARRSALIDRLGESAVRGRDRVVRVDLVSRINDEFLRRGHELYAADLFHPNRAGHQFVAEAVTDEVAAALAAQGLPRAS
ncbi:MAG TPA: GDSL-type esterase/lipase family protein [Microthrixaceae bacterium]|nr:GDSL-type esterase/lipase family protein [Microthrixaceae bacterium]